ncbi:MAG: L-rhamnose mutarotase [Actinobacteria bacterium]|nr:L-rhamnose mutarotase [Actinomycetota bacterium]
MENTCVYMKIKPEGREGYINIHKKGNVWKEVLENLKNAGFKKMKIYMLDNYAVVYIEAENIAKAFKYLGKQPDTSRWNEATSAFMETQPDYDSEEVVKQLECVFNFENGVQK